MRRSVRTRRTGNSRNARNGIVARLCRLLLQWVLYIPTHLCSSTVRFYFDIGFIVSFLAASLLYFLSHLLLVEDHPTFSVIARRNQWDVQRKAFICQRAGRWYVLLSLCFITPRVAFFLFNSVVSRRSSSSFSANRSGKGRAGIAECRMFIVASSRILVRFSVAVIHFIFWLCILTPWRTLLMTRRLHAEGITMRQMPMVLLRLARQRWVAIPQRFKRLFSEEVWNPAPFPNAETGGSPPLVSLDPHPDVTCPPPPPSALSVASLTERRYNQRYASWNGSGSELYNNSDKSNGISNKIVADYERGRSGKKRVPLARESPPPLFDGKGPPDPIARSPDDEFSPHVMINPSPNSVLLYSSPLQDGVVLLQSPEESAGGHSRTSSGSSRVQPLGGWGGIHQRQYSRTLRTATPPISLSANRKRETPSYPPPPPDDSSPRQGNP